MELNGKVSIVTGGSSGIGRATALALAKEGSNVVIADINIDQAKEVANEVNSLSRESLIVQVNIANKSEVQDMAKQVLKKFNRIDTLVNCAGILRFSSVEDLSEKDWDDQIDVNLKGTFLCSQAVIKTMKKQRSGKIVNISSCAAKNWIGRASAGYATSKAGVSNFTICLAKEMAPYGVCVNAIAPALIETPMTRSKEYGEGILENAAAKVIPLGFFGKAEDIANAVLFLVSDKSRYITGEILDVNGGLIMD